MLCVAAASVDITPATPCPLAGFVGRPGPFTEVSSTLEANAAVFHDESGRCALLLTLDTLFVGPMVHSRLTEHFVAHGHKADDIVILASHTHFAPSLDPTKPALGEVAPDYAALVIERCSNLIDRVMRELARPAHFERRSGSSNAAINRRRRWPLPHFYGRRLVGPQTVMAPNPAGPTDPTVTTLAVVAASGEAIALLWHFACHPTAFPRAHQISADFPGVVRARLRQRYGATLPILFLQGFAGDLRPRVPESRPFVRRAFNCILSGPNFDSFTFNGWRRWSDDLADDVLGTFEGGASVHGDSSENTPEIGSASHSIPLGQLMSGESENRPVRFQRLRLSAELDVVAVATEPLTGLRALVTIEGALGVGYLGDVFGYWPTDRDAIDGGYEVRHFVAPFGLHGRLRRQLDATFRKGVQGLRLLQ